jgi:hypothetical protein
MPPSFSAAASRGALHWRQHLSHAANLAFLPALVALCALLVRACDPAFFDQTDLHLLTLNALPFAFVGLLIRGLSGRSLISLALTWLLIDGVYALHRIKLEQLAEPLLPGDLLMVPQVLGNLGFFLRYWQPGLPALIVAVLMATLWWLEYPGWPRGWLSRLTIAAVASLGLSSLIYGVWPWRDFYSPEWLVFQPWSPRTSAAASGMPAYFIRLSWSSQLRPAAPDLERIASLMGRLGKEAPPFDSVEQPDIVVLQSESFFDVGRLRGIDRHQHVPNLLALRARAVSGELSVPAYGGMTTRTEFEVLTGVSLRAVPTIQYPYQGLVHAPLRSLASVLRAKGYTTTGIHPYPASFYRRNTVFPRLGFERFIDLSEFKDAPKHGYFVSDEALTDRILSELDAPGEAPRFIYAVSIENHGPWNRERRARLPETPAASSPAHLAPELAEGLDTYLHHLRRADAALAQLVQGLDRRSRPTLLLFFGDHLPGLHTAFAELGFKDGMDPWKQSTPYLLLHNQKHLSGAIDLDASELGAMLLDVAGITGTGHFQDLARIRHSKALTPDEAVQLRIELARLALAAGAPEGSPSSKPLQIVDLTPRKLAVRADADEPVLLNLRAVGLPSGAGLHLGGEALTSRSTETGLQAMAPVALLRRVQAGEVPPTVEVSIPGGTPMAAGEIEILITDPRSLSGSFCEIQKWGPDSMPVGRPVNPQPDGSEGLWFKLDCFPQSAQVSLDGHPLQTFHQPRLLTAKLPVDLIGLPGTFNVEFRDPVSGDRFVVGQLTVH